MMASEVDKFWDIVESKLGCSVPKYLQNILAMRGYDNPHSIKMLTLDDLNELQNYIKIEEMMARVPQNADLRDYFGVFYATPSECYILPVHIKLLQVVVEVVKLSLVSKGIDHFCIKQKQVQQVKSSSKALFLPRLQTSSRSTPITTESTSNDHDVISTSAKMQAHHTDSALSNEDDLEVIAFASINLTTDHAQNQQSHSQGIFLQSNNIYTVIDDENSSGDVRNANADVMNEQLEHNRELPNNVNIQKQQENLLQNVKLWIKKNFRGLYEKHSYKMTTKMIEVKSGPNEIFSVGIRCPMCTELLGAPFVNGAKQTDFFSSSYFQRHIRRVHIKRVTRSSAKSDENSEAKPEAKPSKAKKMIKPKSKRQKRNYSNTDIDESDDSENDEIAKELAKNYLNESDDLTEEETDDHFLQADESTGDIRPAKETRKRTYDKLGKEKK